MKKLILIHILVFALFRFGFSKECETNTKLSLIAYLTHVKGEAEAKMIELSPSLMVDSISKETLSTITSYYNLKVSVDKFINQLSADLYQRNGLGHYKKLNSYVKDSNFHLNDNLKYYKELIEDIDCKFNIIKQIESFIPMKEKVTIEEITAFLTLGHDIVVGMRDHREKKVQSMTELLKEMKLQSLGSLLKEDE